MSTLARGGLAVDAAVAAQMVLGLVEPQSSGIGGGSLAMYWDAATGTLSSWDGLAAAPARTTAGLTIDTDASVLPEATTRRGGRSVGVPGTLALFEELHRRHGRLPWASLFEPAIALAEQGFAMPPYLHEVLSNAPAESLNATVRALYLDAQGRPWAVGTLVRNPAYAETLRQVAALGPRAWLAAGAARRLVAAAQEGGRPSLMTEADLLAYRALPREPLCQPFQSTRVCMMGPASFGGVAVLQMLAMAPLPGTSPLGRPLSDPDVAHRFVEAGRLAQADRIRDLGDPAFTAVPLSELLEPSYLQSRAALIQAQRAMTDVRAGVLSKPQAMAPEPVAEVADATSQIAIVDAAGNALSITTTINLNFGAWLMVDGYVLNNAMTNFSSAPSPGQTKANQMAPGKRPVTSMAPTIVFDAERRPVVVGGSAGGGQIVDYIAASLMELLANGKTPAEALASGHLSTAVAGVVQLEKGTHAERLAPSLQAKGHKVQVTEMKSGLAFLQRRGHTWLGAADPRRDGSAQVVSLPSP